MIPSNTTKGSKEQEQAVISAMLVFPAIVPEIAAIVTSEDFYERIHQRIYSVMLRHHVEEIPIEVPALMKSLSHTDVCYLGEIQDIATISETATYYARQIKTAALYREVQGLAAELQQFPERAATITSKISGLTSQRIDISSKFVSAKEFLTTPQTVDYLIHNLVERDTTGQLFGPSGGGKTFTAIDWALCVATGGSVNGCKVKQGLVFYLAGEGHNGLQRRVKAWQVHHDMSVDALRLIHLSRHAISFDGGQLHTVKTEARELSQIHGMPVALIVIDTLARHLQGDENNAKDMSYFIKTVDSLRESFPGCVALIVHHTGHTNPGEDAKTRGRGSSALRAAMDFEIHCSKGLLSFTKMKDGATPEPIHFTLSPVVIGRNTDGEPLTSCIVDYGERSKQHQETELTSMELTAVKALIGASSSIKTHEECDIVALLEDWREAFYSLRRADDQNVKPNTLKNSFLRAVEGLIGKKIVLKEGHLRILSKEFPSSPLRGTDRHKTSQMTRGITRHTSHPLSIGCDDVTVASDDDHYMQTLVDDEPQLWGQA